MVLQDVNGNGKKSPAADRWLRQRNGPRASAARCIFGPPEKRAHLAIIMRNEAEMERKRRDFAARYEPVGLSPAERSRFFEGLVKTAASPSSSSSPATSSHGHNNGEYGNVKFVGRARFFFPRLLFYTSTKSEKMSVRTKTWPPTENAPSEKSPAADATVARSPRLRFRNGAG